MKEKHLSITIISVEFGVASGPGMGGRRPRYPTAESLEIRQRSSSEGLTNDM